MTGWLTFLNVLAQVAVCGVLLLCFIVAAVLLVQWLEKR